MFQGKISQKEGASLVVRETTLEAKNVPSSHSRERVRAGEESGERKRNKINHCAIKSSSAFLPSLGTCCLSAKSYSESPAQREGPWATRDELNKPQWAAEGEGETVLNRWCSPVIHSDNKRCYTGWQAERLHGGWSGDNYNQQGKKREEALNYKVSAELL